MTKIFYTEREIEALVKNGVTNLEVTDQVVLTGLAYEMAKKLGLQLIQDHPDAPPNAPLRPYISKIPVQAQPINPFPAPVPPTPAPQERGAAPASPQEPSGLHERIRSAVLARMGGQIDADLLDMIITRVLKATGVR